MNFDFLLSIIIPMYNSSFTILSTLESIYKSIQNHTSINKIEVIIVDDGSEDNSYDFVKAFSLSHTDLIIRLFNQTNQGVSSARNLGLLNSNGKYVYFLDSDDYVKPSFFNYILKILSHTYNDIIVFGYDVSDSNGNIKSEFYKIYNHDLDFISGIDLLEKSISDLFSLWTSSIVYKKSYLSNHNLRFGNYYVREDVNFAHKALINAKSVKHIKKSLVVYRRTPGSLSTRKDIKIFDGFYASLEILKILEKQGLENEIINKYRLITLNRGLAKTNIFIANQSNNCFENIRLIEHAYPGFFSDLRKIKNIKYDSFKSFLGNNFPKTYAIIACVKFKFKNGF